MAENNKAVKAGIGYVIGNYLIKGMLFLTLPIFARLLNTNDYGLYNTFVATEGLLYVIVGFAIHVSYKSAWYKYEGENHKEYYEFASCTMVLIVISTIVFSLCAFLFSDILQEYTLLDRKSLILLTIYSGAAATLGCFNAHLGILYEYKKFLGISGLNAFVNIALSIILILTIFSNQKYFGRILGIVTPSVIISLYIYRYFYKKAKPKNYKKHLTWGLRYSLPIVPNGIGQVILSQFDRLMINKIISPSAAGIYSFAYNIFGLVNVTALSLDNAYSPWCFEKMKAKNYNLVNHKSKIYSVLMCLFSSFIIVISPELVEIIGTPDYFEAKHCVIPLLAGGYFLFLSSMPICIEYYYEKTRVIAIGTLIAALINILLNCLFIPKFGYVAGAYTTLFTYIMYFIFHMIQAYKAHGSMILPLKIFILCSVGVMCILFFSVAIFQHIFIRYAMGLVIVIVMIYFLEVYMSIISKCRNTIIRLLKY